MKLLSYAFTLASLSFMATGCDTQNNGTASHINAVNNVSHFYDFHMDWGFPRQYMKNENEKYVKSWSCIYNSDLSNANLLFLFNGEDRLPYVEKDFAAINEFLKQGGGVMMLSSGNSVEQNKLVSTYGASFVKGFERPLKGLEFANGEVATKGYGCYLKLDEPKKWNVVVEDNAGNPMLAYRKVNKGTVLVGSKGLLGDNPDSATDTINHAMWTQLWAKVAAGKQVDPNKEFKTEYIEKVENNITRDGLNVSFNDYLAPCGEAMFDISKRCMPVIEKTMGVPLSDGMGSKIVLIPTDGGGYSSGEVIALAVWWGGFPEKEDSMIEFVTHEAVHSWVLPHAEIWNEPIATYVGNLVMCQMGHEEEGKRRIQDCINRAKAVDPKFDLYDMRGNSSKKGIAPLEANRVNDVHWGKAFWIFEQLRAENPQFMAEYFKAKRQHATKEAVAKYDDNNTVAVMSIAMNRDLFPWFRSIGFDVDRKKADVKF
ncbi:MAG: hypothetical protein ACRDDZ_06430 [Marinifilaceae bacterium]